MAEKKKAFLMADYIKPEDVSNSDTKAFQIELIDIDSIESNDLNFYELSNLKPLADSILIDGLQQPLVVMTSPDDSSRVRLLSGHRRRAAIQMLVEDNETPHSEFRLVPCIRKSYSSTAMAELQLILANSTARELTSAEKMKQAEKIETLLCQLKEEGYNFPGRMRDQVAAACNASASKLARLAVIRKGLSKKSMKLFEAGKINESVAYELAKLDADIQDKFINSRENPEYIYAHSVTSAADYLEKLGKLKCKKTKGECENKEIMFAEMIRPNNYNHMPCKYGSAKCCGECDYLYSCKAACSKFEEQIKKHKADTRQANKETKAAEKTESEKIASRNATFWVREAYARGRAGVSIEDFKTAIGRKWMQDEKLLSLESGCAEDNSDGSQMLDLTGKQYIKLADLYGCSVDYLLCQTDDPRPYPAPQEAC